jgi:hypothetical protein
LTVDRWRSSSPGKAQVVEVLGGKEFDHLL